MTRLRSDDIIDIAAQLDRHDLELTAKTGNTLKDTAAKAAALDLAENEELIRTSKVAVIPITAGRGLIEGFSETLRQIATHLGFAAFTTSRTDAAGLAEAYERDSDIVMLADDIRFVAINTRTRAVIDNSLETGKAFSIVLDKMASGVEGRDCLVIGCGPVGCSAAETLCKLGANVSVCDKDLLRAKWVSDCLQCTLGADIQTIKDLKKALQDISLVVDATPVANIIDPQDLRTETYISAPGVPHGLSSGALEYIGVRFYYDPIRLGVASMLLSALTPKREDSTIKDTLAK